MSLGTRERRGRRGPVPEIGRSVDRLPGGWAAMSGTMGGRMGPAPCGLAPRGMARHEWGRRTGLVPETGGSMDRLPGEWPAMSGAERGRSQRPGPGGHGAAPVSGPIPLRPVHNGEEHDVEALALFGKPVFRMGRDLVVLGADKQVLSFQGF